MVVLGAIAGDEAVTTGTVKPQAGVFQTRSPAPAPKHLGRGRREHWNIEGWVLTLSLSVIFS
jgi:hypothetical protein